MLARRFQFFMNIRPKSWRSHPVSRAAGAVLLAMPMFLAHRPDAIFPATLFGLLGWWIGPVFFVQPTVRRAVIRGAIICASAAFLFCLSVGLFFSFGAYDPIGLLDDGFGSFRDLTALAAFGGYAGGIVGCCLGWALVLSRHLRTRVAKGSR